MEAIWRCDFRGTVTRMHIRAGFSYFGCLFEQACPRCGVVKAVMLLPLYGWKGKQPFSFSL